MTSRTVTRGFCARCGNVRTLGPRSLCARCRREPQPAATTPAKPPLELQYYVLSRSWYAEASLRGRTDGVVDEVNFGAVYPDGSGTWEAEFRWVMLEQPRPHVVCELSVFDGAWSEVYAAGVFKAAAHLQDVNAHWQTADARSASVAQVCAMLEQLGFRDATVEVDPHGAASAG